MATQTRGATVLSTDASGIVPWTNPPDASACDPFHLGPYAQATYGAFQVGTSDNLVGTTFGFAIPVGATVNGIETIFSRHANAVGVFDSTIRILQAGVPGGVDHGTFVDWPIAIDADLIVGGAADLWGLAWTPAQINAAGFGVQIAIDNTVGGVAGFIGCYQLRVTFTPAVGAAAGGFLLRGVSPS